ncbi:MAG: MFS transporter [Thermomicrobiales bacterium]|nr:MFS transporter [Thermomicrobiales bacterium]
MALIWTAVTFAAIAIVPEFWMIVALAGAAGLGSGAFHPFGALNADAVIDDRRRNSAMSVYASGGTVGFAIGPLIGVGLLALFGIHGLALMIVPGTAIAIWLLLEMRKIAVKGSGSRRGRTGLPPIPWLALSAVILVMMARSWTMSSLQAFIPTWYDDMGYSEAFYGFLATTITLASALGTLGSGSLADRYGRRALIVVSLIATIPAILLFTAVHRWHRLPDRRAGRPAGRLDRAAPAGHGAAAVQGRAGVASGLVTRAGLRHRCDRRAGHWRDRRHVQHPDRDARAVDCHPDRDSDPGADAAKRPACDQIQQRGSETPDNYSPAGAVLVPSGAPTLRRLRDRTAAR